MSKTKRSYLISAGNSSVGPVGFCMRVKAFSKEEALAKAKEALPEETCEIPPYNDDEDVEYLNVYYNDMRLTMSDIVDEETMNVCTSCDQTFFNETPDEVVCPDCEEDDDEDA